MRIISLPRSGLVDTVAYQFKSTIVVGGLEFRLAAGVAKKTIAYRFRKRSSSLFIIAQVVLLNK